MADEEFGGEFWARMEGPKQENRPPSPRGFGWSIGAVRWLIAFVVLIGFGIYELIVIPSTSSATFVDRLVAAKRLDEAREAEKRLLERDRSRFRGDQELIARIPRLISLLGVRNDQAVVHVLAGIGRPAIQPMIAALDAPTPPVGFGGFRIDDDSVKCGQLKSLFEAFKSLRAEAPEAASRLARYLGHHDAMVCDKCVETLVAFGHDSVQPLVAILDDPQTGGRTKRYAVVALSRIGPQNAEAVPVLRKRLGQTTDSEEKKLIELAIHSAQSRP
ncbi:MAG TPA: hypothetical protein VG055_13310 [Planctomycetaceae bacterium]|jgi:hypothetical protein|nr:hypothetical protein [Planctomycetaceae bacterium]